MTLDEFLSQVKLGGTPIKLCRRNVTAIATAAEMIEFITAAYRAGREQTESDLAMMIASSPIELDPTRPRG